MRHRNIVSNESGICFAKCKQLCHFWISIDACELMNLINWMHAKFKLFLCSCQQILLTDTNTFHVSQLTFCELLQYFPLIGLMRSTNTDVIIPYVIPLNDCTINTCKIFAQLTYANFNSTQL